MELKGQVEDIIYQNEINSYTIAVLNTDKEDITIVGYLPFVNSGDMLKVEGKTVIHPEYGEQFKVDTFEKIMPETEEALEKYLASGTIKGIGSATAKRIIQKFGNDTISVFKFTPEKLADIKGISHEKAIQMGEEFNENWEVWQLVGFLERFGISASNAKKIHKELGANAISVIEENPYLLIEYARGIDFKQIDKLALDFGMDYNSEKRIKSGIKHSLLLVRVQWAYMCNKTKSN